MEDMLDAAMDGGQVDDDFEGSSGGDASGSAVTGKDSAKDIADDLGIHVESQCPTSPTKQASLKRKRGPGEAT